MSGAITDVKLSAVVPVVELSSTPIETPSGVSLSGPSLISLFQEKTHTVDVKVAVVKAPVDEKKYPLFMIYCNKSFAEILNVLNKYADRHKKVAAMQCIYDNMGRQTNMTAVVMSEDIFTAMVADGYREKDRSHIMTIDRFHLKANHLPRNGKKWAVPLPKNLGFDVKAIEHSIRNKMKSFVDFKLFKADEFSVETPLADRIKGTPRGVCFVDFADSVDAGNAAMARICLDNSMWGATDVSFRCEWFVPRQKKTHGAVGDKPVTRSRPFNRNDQPKVQPKH